MVVSKWPEMSPYLLQQSLEDITIMYQMSITSFGFMLALFSRNPISGLKRLPQDYLNVKLSFVREFDVSVLKHIDVD